MLWEMPSYQRGWFYLAHGADIVIVGGEAFEIFESIEDTLHNACEALHWG